MYTKFPHDMIMNRISHFLAHAFRFHAAKAHRRSAFLAVPHHHLYKRVACFWTYTGTLSDAHQKTHTVLNLEGLIERLDFVVRNSYVFWGGEVFHQQIGVAMGLIPAGLIATIVCFTYEIEFLSRCLDRLDSVTRADPRSPEIPKLRAKVQFALLLLRYIDDELHTLVDSFDF